MKKEPALILGLIQAVIVLCVSFGVDLSPEQTAAFLSLTSIAMAITTRQFVSPAKPKGKNAAAALLFVFLLSGCAEFWGAMSKLSQGSQHLGTAIDVAAAGADLYFARHPSQENERRVDAAVRRARTALQLLDAALRVADAVEDEDVARARTEAQEVWTELRGLLAELGVLTATPPDGGAETDAPAPEPFNLPEEVL